MFRTPLLTAVTGLALTAVMASAPTAQAQTYDRDDHPGSRDGGGVRGHDRVRVVVALADPGSLTGFRGRNGRSFYFQVTGNADAGPVWGSGRYTDDSALAAAAVHAGALADGETGVVKVTILAGAGGYHGSDRNGVATGDWGAWDGGYRIERWER